MQLSRRGYNHASNEVDQCRCVEALSAKNPPPGSAGGGSCTQEYWPSRVEFRFSQSGESKVKAIGSVADRKKSEGSSIHVCTPPLCGAVNHSWREV